MTDRVCEWVKSSNYCTVVAVAGAPEPWVLLIYEKPVNTRSLMFPTCYAPWPFQKAMGRILFLFFFFLFVR